jgi:nucleoside-diphosphate-sugar epimerase
MKVLVTGCAGFIGSHLTENLLGKGEVIGIDSFTDFYPRQAKEDNMKGFINNPGFRFVEGDILKIELEGILKEVNTIYHLAAQAGVRDSWGRNFRNYTDNNVLVTQRLLESCKGRDIRFVYASSSSIYGDAENIPVKESDRPRPVSPYGVTKLAGENLCELYSRNYGVPVVVLRYFTVYGPRQRPDMAFNRFAHAIIRGEKIVVYGDGNQTRDFTYVSDIVEGTARAGEKDHALGQVINLAGGSRVSLNKVIEILSELSGREARVEFSDKQKGDVRDTFADISKARKTIGYKPEVDIRTGLELYLRWLKS